MPSLSIRYHCYLCLLILAVVTVSSCVGKGKYLDALQEGEAARSDAAFAKTDLADAYGRIELLQVEYADLEKRLKRLNEQALAERSGSIDEQQNLLNQTVLQDYLIDSLRQDRQRLVFQRTAALQILGAIDQRMLQLQQRIISNLGPLATSAGLRMQRSGSGLQLFLNESAVFAEKRPSAVSPEGDALLRTLASALGGQPDLRIEVVSDPTRLINGGPAAREEAGRRSAAVVSNLVEGHGLAPEIVQASSRQVDAATAPLAPAEFNTKRGVSIFISVAGDHLGELQRALDMLKSTKQ